MPCEYDVHVIHEYNLVEKSLSTAKRRWLGARRLVEMLDWSACS